MSKNGNTMEGLEFAQVGWVVPDIHAAIKFMERSLGVTNFPKPEHSRGQDLNIKYYGKVVPAEWLVSQTYNGIFIELIQPLSGQSIFHDFLAKFPAGGIQHNAYRLPVAGFEKVISNMNQQGYTMISEVDHLIARMAFFDTYDTLGIATEIMGITPEGWKALEQMEKTK